MERNCQNTDYFAKPLFVLKDTLTGQKIYYKYDKEYEHNFPFNTSKINYPADYFCSKIEKENDEFTSEIKFSSPLMSGSQISPMTIYKHINKGKAVYYLSLRTNGSTVNVNESGVIILFQDGTKWTRASKIDVDAGSNGFDCSAFITLTPTDPRTFATKKIKKIPAIYSDEEVTSSDAERFKLFTECIKKCKVTAANSTYKKLAVQWLNEALCFVSSFVVADSLVLRNRQLLVAAKRYIGLKY
ncbi:MAG: hypothetical protein IPF52_15925 [Saprospiraceae bacterium]|nr:hypothetical protein [Saprospiraceae bacterium]